MQRGGEGVATVQGQPPVIPTVEPPVDPPVDPLGYHKAYRANIFK